MELFNVKFREYHHRWHWLIAGLRTTGLDNVFYLTCISNNEDKSVTRTADIVSHTCVLSLMLQFFILQGCAVSVFVCMIQINIYVTNCDVVNMISILLNGFNISRHGYDFFGSVKSWRSHYVCPCVCLSEPEIVWLVIKVKCKRMRESHDIETNRESEEV